MINFKKTTTPLVEEIKNMGEFIHSPLKKALPIAKTTGNATSLKR